MVTNVLHERLVKGREAPLEDVRFYEDLFVKPDVLMDDGTMPHGGFDV